MTDSGRTLVVSGTQDAAEAVQAEVMAQTGSQGYLAQRKNLDGDTASWIVIATLVGQALPHVLGFIKELLVSSQTNNQVKKLKVGDWEVENPTPEIIEKFLAQMAAQAKPGNDDG